MSLPSNTQTRREQVLLEQWHKGRARCRGPTDLDLSTGKRGAVSKVAPLLPWWDVNDTQLLTFVSFLCELSDCKLSHAARQPHQLPMELILPPKACPPCSELPSLSVHIRWPLGLPSTCAPQACTVEPRGQQCGLQATHSSAHLTREGQCLPPGRRTHVEPGAEPEQSLQPQQHSGQAQRAAEALLPRQDQGRQSSSTHRPRCSVTMWFCFQGLESEYEEEGQLLGRFTYDQEGESLQMFHVLVSPCAVTLTSTLSPSRSVPSPTLPQCQWDQLTLTKQPKVVPAGQLVKKVNLNP